MKISFENLKYDLPASIVVFFVAVPLCLGIALASGAPLFSGIIAGIVGGIIVGMASRSPLGVSGPAAGLAVIVLSSIEALGGSWGLFLTAVMLAGLFQLLFGFLKLGTIGYYFPSSVIKGMLTGIGLLIILKQIPHALGYDADYEGDLAFLQPNQENTFSGIINTFKYLSPGAILISTVSLFLLIIWDKILSKRHKIFGIINGPLVAVLAGVSLHLLYASNSLPFSLKDSQIVSLPVPESMSGILNLFSFPDFSGLGNPQVYFIALVIAVIASLETLLCVEATDKLDPYKRVTPTNRELKAQGLGNVISGLIGGLPLTQVIVRSSANINFGGRTKMSAIMHGFFLLIAALSIPAILNLIPLASLAAILLMVGYKLSNPDIFKSLFKQGKEQFIPFVATVIGILATDLLKGIAFGMIVAIFYILRNNFKNPSYMIQNAKTDIDEYQIALAEEVTFLNKGSILQMLNHVPENSKVTIDGSRNKFLHYDIKEIIQNFLTHARDKNIQVNLNNVNLNGQSN